MALGPSDNEQLILRRLLYISHIDKPIITPEQAQYLPSFPEVAEAFEKYGEILTVRMNDATAELKKPYMDAHKAVDEFESRLKKIEETLEAIKEVYFAASALRESVTKHRNMVRTDEPPRYYTKEDTRARNFIKGVWEDHYYLDILKGMVTGKSTSYDKGGLVSTKDIIPFLPDTAKTNAIKAGWTHFLTPSNG